MLYFICPLKIIASFSFIRTYQYRQKIAKRNKTSNNLLFKILTRRRGPCGNCKITTFTKARDSHPRCPRRGRGIPCFRSTCVIFSYEIQKIRKGMIQTIMRKKRILAMCNWTSSRSDKSTFADIDRLSGNVICSLQWKPAMGSGYIFTVFVLPTAWFIASICKWIRHGAIERAIELS